MALFILTNDNMLSLLELLWLCSDNIDFIVTEEAVSFTENQNHTINVTIIDDQEVDGRDEQFVGQLKLNFGPQSVQLKNPRITITITDNGLSIRTYVYFALGI